ncbi:MAG: hypothetical protein JXR36_15290, partial [Bacteroidales bacterium]|nr:hypothetical protein [Bacteroidales bacterium]
MKKATLIFVLLCSANVFFAQSIVFNKTYSGNTPGLRNIIIQEDGFVGLGFDVNDGRIRIFIIKTDFYGDTVWTKKYGDSYYSYYHGTRNSLISNIDGGFSLAGSRKNEINNTCLLVKFDQNFDTIWTKLFFDNPDFTAFYNHIQTSDGGYALVGYTNESDADGDVLLVKTDSDGNMLWYKKYGTSGYDAGYCIVETPDNGFLIGGECGLGNTDGYLVKTDSGGNQEWTKHYGHPSYPDGSIFTIGITSQNEYILPVGYITTPISEDFYNRKYRFIKLDSDFNEVWNKEYGIEAEYTSLGTIAVANDGDIWATIKDNNNVGLFHLSPNGDSISKHYYSAEGSIGDRSLLSIKQTSDNGFIMAGVAYDPQVMWLVKTDSCGCVEEDCECGGSEVE